MVTAEALLERYERTYGRHLAKAADRLTLAHQEVRIAERQEDPGRLADLARIITALQGVLDGHEACRRCGRILHDPEAIAAHIGPECAKRPEP